MIILTNTQLKKIMIVLIRCIKKFSLQIKTVEEFASVVLFLFLIILTSIKSLQMYAIFLSSRTSMVYLKSYLTRFLNYLFPPSAYLNAHISIFCSLYFCNSFVRNILKIKMLPSAT